MPTPTPGTTEPIGGLFTDHLPVLAPGRVPFAKALESLESPDAKAIALEAWRLTMMEGKAMLPCMFLAPGPDFDPRVDLDPLRHLCPEKYFGVPEARRVADACRYGMGHSVAEFRRVAWALRELTARAAALLMEILWPYGGCWDTLECDNALRRILDHRYGAGMRVRVQGNPVGDRVEHRLVVGAGVAGLYEKAAAPCFTDPEKPMARPEDLRAMASQTERKTT